MLRSDWALFRGEYAEAERLAEDALQLGERAQSWDAGFSYRLVLFFLRRDQGRLEEMQEGIRQSVHEYAGYRLFRPLVSLLDLELGRDEAARAAFNELARDDFSFFPRDGEWLFCLSILGEVAAWLRDTDRAQALYTLLLPYAGLNALATAEATAGPVARYLGLLASAAEQWDDAARHFEDALDMSTRMGARPWVSRTQCDLVQMLSVRGRDGDGERADALAAEAEATAAELGLQGVRERLNAPARG